jgi:hypothetical protein
MGGIEQCHLGDQYEQLGEEKKGKNMKEKERKMKDKRKN